VCGVRWRACERILLAGLPASPGLLHQFVARAAEGLADVQSALFRFANTNVAFDKLGEVGASQPGWGHKLNLVASIDTIEALARANALLGSAYFDLLRRRNLLQQSDDQIQITNQQIEQIKSYQEHMRALIESLAADTPTEASTSRAEWAAGNFVSAQQHLGEMVAQLETQIDRRWSLHRDLFKATVEHYGGYQMALAAAMVALRREIDLPIDLERYERVTRTHAQHVEHEISNVLNDIGLDETRSAPESANSRLQPPPTAPPVPQDEQTTRAVGA
jgi:hypothetical protein